MRLKDSIQSDSGQLITNLETGTAPLAVASTTKVANLNADKIDDLDSMDFMRAIAHVGGYYQMAAPGANKVSFIRTTSQGLLPCESSGSIFVGSSQIGSDTAPFGGVYSRHFDSQWVHVNKGKANDDGGVTLYGADWNYIITFRSSYGTLANSNSTYGINEGWAMFFRINDQANRGWIFRRGSTNRLL